QIEASLDTGGGDEDPAAARLYSRIAFLQKVNAALTNQRSVDGLVRELQMKLPHFMDYVVLEVLIAGPGEPKLHVFQAGPVEHDVVWKLAEDLCTAVAPFSEQALAPEALAFVETAPSSRPGTDAGESPVTAGEATTLTLPMVFCGELVGGIGVV